MCFHYTRRIRSVLTLPLYTCAFGFPVRWATISECTVELLFALQRGGADIIEVGVPFTDPIAEGTIIQQSNQVPSVY